jgi:hypothetical protein
MENHKIEDRAEDMELALLPEPGKAVGSLGKAIESALWRQARWQDRIEELSRPKEKARK